MFDPQGLRPVWINAAGLAYWRAESLEALAARDFSRLPAATLQRVQAGVALQAQGHITRATWLVDVQGEARTSTLATRAIRLPDARQGMFFLSEPLLASYDPQVLRGIQALEHTAVRVMLHTLDGKLPLMRNPAAEAAFGPLADDRRALREHFCDAALAAHVLQSAAHDQAFAGEAELLTVAGPCWHALDTRPVPDPVTGRTVLQIDARDISDLKAAQQALVQTRDAAEAANRAKSAFLANMSHEIRTPMNGVLGLTELVLETELDARQRQHLTLVHESAKSLLAVISDILDISKIEADELRLELAPLQLRGLLDDTLQPQRLLAQARSLTLQWAVDDNVPDALQGDATRVRQIVLNLVSNAIKFTHHGDIAVTISLGDAAGGSSVPLVLSVRDSGIGMNQEALAIAFDRFSQADDSITRRYGGTGLGLAIVQALATRMGGGVRVNSAPGQGSEFIVTLALARAAA